MRFFTGLFLIFGCLFFVASKVEATGSGHHHDHHYSETKKGHDHSSHSTDGLSGIERTVRWIGSFHPLAVHFPIALILTTVLAELLFYSTGSVLYGHAAKFMIVTAAFAALPTALLGLANAYGVDYGPDLENTLWWHRFLGFAVVLLSTTTAFLKVFQEKTGKRLIYFTALFLLAFVVSFTGYLGGEM